MSEERKNMYKQVVVKRKQSVCQLHRLVYIKGIFVLLYGKAKEMTIVVQDNA